MNISVNLVANKYLQALALDVLRLDKDDEFIANKIFREVENLLTDSSYSLDKALTNLDDHYPVEFDFLTPLEKYDTLLSASNYTPNWMASPDGIDVFEADHLGDLATKAFLGLVNEDRFIESLLYYQLLCTAFLGGLGTKYMYDDLDHSVFLAPYKELKAKAIAYILQQDYHGVTIKSVPKGVEPIDISNIPDYLLEDNPQIIMKDSKVYLKIDVEKAITAAGGLAQTMERQDLEGKTTNGAKKSDEINQHKSTERDDNEETGETEETSRKKTSSRGT